jgi:hypothetical protein
MKKEYGGLGIPNIRELNLCLLASWIRRYSLDDNKLWKQIIDFKYDTEIHNVFNCREIDVSPFWKGVLWVARAAKLGYQCGRLVKETKSGFGKTNGWVIRV